MKILPQNCHDVDDMSFYQLLTEKNISKSILDKAGEGDKNYPAVFLILGPRVRVTPGAFTFQAVKPPLSSFTRSKCAGRVRIFASRAAWGTGFAFQRTKDEALPGVGEKTD